MPISPTLRDRILGKIVMAGPATPCATWVGAYNRHGRRGRMRWFARPVVWAGGSFGPVIYVANALLRLSGAEPPTSEHREACHCCPTGTPVDGVYRCVDLDHLRWGTRAENEADKHAR